MQRAHTKKGAGAGGGRARRQSKAQERVEAARARKGRRRSGWRPRAHTKKGARAGGGSARVKEDNRVDGGRLALQRALLKGMNREACARGITWHVGQTGIIVIVIIIDRMQFRSSLRSKIVESDGVFSWLYSWKSCESQTSACNMEKKNIVELSDSTA